MDADVAVIGAGALGLSTALHCALAGRSVVVVERDTAGSQASGRAAGLFKSVQADELRTWLARRSIERALTFEDWAGPALPVEQPGSFLIARTPEHQGLLRTELARSRGWGTDVSQVSSADLAGRSGYYHGSPDDYALWCPADSYIAEPIDLINAYAAACRLHGAVLAESEAAIGVSLARGQVAGVRTERRLITAPVVVDAAGAWVRQVARLAGPLAGQLAPVVPVVPVRHQLLITEPTAQVGGAGTGDPIVRVVDAAVYLRPARGGLMIGGFESAPLPVPEPPASTGDVPLDLGVLERMAAMVAPNVPAAASLAVAEHRGGLFTMSPDGRFVAGPVPGLPGLWVASGCNGSGFSSSLALGEALAGSICGAAGARDISPLAPGRFGAVTEEALIARGVWQYAHYYDPVHG